MNDFVDITTNLNYSVSIWNQMTYDSDTDYNISVNGFIYGVTNSDLNTIETKGLKTFDTVQNQFENINEYKRTFEFKNYSDIVEKDVYKDVHNSFNYRNVFLSEIDSEPLVLKQGCPLFITVSNKKFYNSYNCNFVWKLFLDSREIGSKNDKLLIISDKSFLVWHFDTIGQYSLELSVTSDKYGIEFNKFYNKKIIVG